MNELLNELKKSLDNKLYISSLNTALIIPDICSALQSSNGKTTGKKYINWFNYFVAKKYNDNLQGSDVYKIRCATLHEGKFNSNYDLFDKIIFQIPEANVIMHNCISSYNSESELVVLILNIEIFINDIIDGFNDWMIEMVKNPFYEENLKQSFKFNPNGISSHFVGLPVLS